MSKKDQVMADRFAAALVYFTQRDYCIGAATPEEFQAATVDWLFTWIDITAKRIPAGTVCPSRR